MDSPGVIAVDSLSVIVANSLSMIVIDSLSMTAADSLSMIAMDSLGVIAAVNKTYPARQHVSTKQLGWLMNGHLRHFVSVSVATVHQLISWFPASKGFLTFRAEVLAPQK